MTFEEYIEAVVKDYQMGGRTWGQSYWLTLKEVRPDLFKKFEESSYVPNPAQNEAHLGMFISYAFIEWYKG